MLLTSIINKLFLSPAAASIGLISFAKILAVVIKNIQTPKIKLLNISNPIILLVTTIQAQGI